MPVGGEGMHVDFTMVASCMMLCVGCSVLLEEGYSEETVEGLQNRGHVIYPNVRGHDRAVFGRGQIIKRDPKTGVLWGGSEPRADGQVLGW